MNINKNRRMIVILIYLLIMSTVLLSCGHESVEKEPKCEKLIINNGSIIENNNGSYSNLNYKDGKYLKVDNANQEIIGIYDRQSGNYLMQSKDKYIACYKDSVIDLNNIEVGDNRFNLAPMGNYLLLFRTSEVKIIDFQTGEYIDFTPEVAISGRFIDWVDEDTLVYYGISEAKEVNGIFTYDIATKEEKVLVKFEEGAVDFIKSIDNGVVYVQDKIDGTKELKYISLEDKVDRMLSRGVKNIYDVIKSKDEYYILGAFKGMNDSLYKLSGGNLKRLVYGFPGRVNVRKGLSQSEEGDILFLGSDISEDLEEIYKCTKEGAVNQVYQAGMEVNFIRRYVN